MFVCVNPDGLSPIEGHFQASLISQRLEKWNVMWFIRRMEKYLFFKHAEALELIVRFDYRVWAPDFSNESVCPNL